MSDAVRRIVSVLYFAHVFDTALPDQPPFSHRLEREAALSYHQGDPARPPAVTHPDLDFVCALGRALTTRPMVGRAFADYFSSPAIKAFPKILVSACTLSRGPGRNLLVYPTQTSKLVTWYLKLSKSAVGRP